jgi:hypothetical protein
MLTWDELAQKFRSLGGTAELESAVRGFTDARSLCELLRTSGKKQMAANERK